MAARKTKARTPQRVSPAKIVAGLEATHRGGVRFPTPVAMRSTVTMPPKYRDLLESLDDPGS